MTEDSAQLVDAIAVEVDPHDYARPFVVAAIEAVMVAFPDTRGYRALIAAETRRRLRPLARMVNVPTDRDAEIAARISGARWRMEWL